MVREGRKLANDGQIIHIWYLRGFFYVNIALQNMEQKFIVTNYKHKLPLPHWKSEVFSLNIFFPALFLYGLERKPVYKSPYLKVLLEYI